MFTFGEAKNTEINVIAIEGMSAQAQAKVMPIAKEAVRHVIIAAAAMAFERDLMRPALVDRSFG